MNPLKTAAAAAVLSAAVLAAVLPAMATAIPSNTVALRTAVADDVTLTQVTRSARQRALGPENYAAGAGPARPDTIGSLGYDGRGYGYNRFSGQVYQSCVEDLGYGRVRPCDAGSH